jgi:acyl-CoA thioesterase-1
MKYVVLILTLLLTACGGGGAGGPAATVVTLATPSGPVVFIGDSITASWAIPAGAVNAGVGGQNSAQMLMRFDTDVMRHKPSRVVIEAGTNDVGGAGASTNSIRAMVDIATATGAGVTVVNVMSRNVPLPTPLPAVRADIQAFNESLRTMCIELRCRYVDAYTATVMPDGALNPALTTDGLHMNADGYKILNGIL